MASDSYFEIARSDDAVYVRVVGLGNMNNASTFSEFCAEMRGKGYRKFVIDLEACRGVDSTFMGSLLGLQRDGEGETAKKGKNGSVLLVNVDHHCKRQLSSVGLDQILQLREGPAELPKKLAMHRLEERKVSAKDQVKLVLKAHKALIELDKRNESKFGAFLQALTRELGEG